jgi:hypothetical protein
VPFLAGCVRIVLVLILQGLAFIVSGRSRISRGEREIVPTPIIIGSQELILINVAANVLPATAPRRLLAEMK